MASSSSAVLTSLLIGGAIGYYLGANSSSQAPTSPTSPQSSIDSFAQRAPVVQELKVDDTEDEEIAAGTLASAEGLGSIKASLFEECKLVLVVRADLGMTKGKIAAQCGHATLACYRSLLKHNPSLLRHWERTGQAKIALRCDSEDELLVLQATAQSLNICAQSIQDAGRTQIAAGSTTVLGIGPAPVELVNQVTGHLKLL